MSANNIKIYEIFKDLDFSKNELKIIDSVLHKVSVKKGTLLIITDEVVDQLYYIDEGCLRTYHIDNQGKEHTIQLAIKDWWITDFTAYFSSSKAIMNLEVLQDATLYKLSVKNRELLMSQIPQIETYIRKKLEAAFSILQKRILANISQTAAEQYKNFITSYPDIEKSVKNYHIASYLGITTESLSRIRKELSNS